MTTVNMRPIVIDLKLYAGDYYGVSLEPVNGEDEPADLSDRTWTAQWRRSRTPEGEGVDLEVDETQAAAGIIVVHFRSEMTREFAKTGVWDIQGVDDDDQALTLATGNVAMLGDVTP